MSKYYLSSVSYHTFHYVNIIISIFQIPEHERWPAAVVLMLKGLQEIASGQKKAMTTAAATSNTSSEPPDNSLQSFVRTHLRQIILRPDLECYGRSTGRKKNAAVSPYSLIKASSSYLFLDVTSGSCSWYNYLGSDRQTG